MNYLGESEKRRTDIGWNFIGDEDAWRGFRYLSGASGNRWFAHGAWVEEFWSLNRRWPTPRAFAAVTVLRNGSSLVKTVRFAG